ncbi:hypothetical protein B9K05_10335 [Acetobacter syzygii]|uniref:Uncharacterized protein n=1 Tax=Acetobacter syzygii TaxID=146476 RepID=A0A270BEI0_9PROT|nr:hypothetical protein B9K05_10335 [Acetobacter syzygii]
MMERVFVWQFAGLSHELYTLSTGLCTGTSAKSVGDSGVKRVFAPVQRQQSFNPAGPARWDCRPSEPDGCAGYAGGVFNTYLYCIILKLIVAPDHSAKLARKIINFLIPVILQSTP